MRKAGIALLVALLELLNYQIVWGKDCSVTSTGHPLPDYHQSVALDLAMSEAVQALVPRDRYGVPQEPDDPDELEIESVEVVTAKPACDIQDILTTKQLDAIEQEAWAELAKEPREKEL